MSKKYDESDSDNEYDNEYYYDNYDNNFENNINNNSENNSDEDERFLELLENKISSFSEEVNEYNYFHCLDNQIINLKNINLIDFLRYMNREDTY